MLLAITLITIFSFIGSSDIAIKVLDANTGQSLPGATVQIIKLNKAGQTNTDGLIEFKSTVPGRYTVRVSFIGFQTKELLINHSADSLWVIELQPALIQSDDIIVTGSPLGKNIQYQPAQALAF